MLLKKHQVSFEVPEPIYDILNVTIANRMGLIYALNRISPGQMAELQKKEPQKSGMPQLWSLEDYNRVTFHPRPDQDYENCRVEYVPTPKVL